MASATGFPVVRQTSRTRVIVDDGGGGSGHRGDPGPPGGTSTSYDGEPGNSSSRGRRAVGGNEATERASGVWRAPTRVVPVNEPPTTPIAGGSNLVSRSSPGGSVGREGGSTGGTAPKSALKRASSDEPGIASQKRDAGDAGNTRPTLESIRGEQAADAIK